MDDNAADVELTADSEIGSGLLRMFGRNDTLADANTVAFAVSTAREEILTELEQNIIHNQYLTKEMLFDDIKAMTQAAGPIEFGALKKHDKLNLLSNEDKTNSVTVT